MEKVMEKANELGMSVVQSTAFIKVQQAEKDLLGDPNAQKLLKRFNELQEAQKEKSKENQSLSAEEMKELEQVQLGIMENRAIKAFTEAQSDFQHMMNKVMEAIKDCGLSAIKEQS